MDSFISAFDNHMKGKQFGENLHAEHAWSKKSNELITQFFFQLVRTKDTKDLEQQLKSLLQRLTWQKDREELTTLYKLIGQTRDIVAGKGEYNLAFMQLAVWWDFYPELAFFAFKLFVKYSENTLDHQYGSWKDIKYMCNYLAENSQEGRDHPFISCILNFASHELRLEWNKAVASEQYAPGLIGRWLPREKSKKFGWIHARLAALLFPEFVREPAGGWKSKTQQKKAGLKQKINLTRILTTLSKKTDTPQIKMCDPTNGGRWSELKFNNVTSLTLRKQKNAIMNRTKKGELRSTKDDRVKCAKNYNDHLAKAAAGDKTAKIHGKRCNVGELVKDALHNGPHAADTVNQQWESNKENNKGLEQLPAVAMCDTSGSMECDDGTPLYNAMGLSLRMSELCHPAFRNRILTFSARPTWVQFSDNETFVAKVSKLRTADWGCNTDFHAALDKILEVLVQENVDPKTVQNMLFACFSDMQFDTAAGQSIHAWESAQESIVRKFAAAGMRTKYKRPYDPPHFLFWNLRKTSGFPATTCTKNVTFLSGYSSALLNLFCEKGLDALREGTPSTQLDELLSNRRYDAMNKIIADYMG